MGISAHIRQESAERHGTDERKNIIDALQAFASGRPGMEFGNYGDARAFRAEAWSITKDLHDARVLLGQVRWRSSITAQKLKDALNRAFSGHLSWDGKKLDYCTGQYFPTEYRKAVCAVCATALWEYWRENGSQDVRATAHKELGLAIGRRWFN